MSNLANPKRAVFENLARIGAALSSAVRLEQLERSGDADVSAEAPAALVQTHELNTTLDELLTVARTGSTKERTELDLTTLVDHQVAEHELIYC